MRRLVLALAIGMLVASGAVVVAVQPVRAAFQTKVVIVVGATQSLTAEYRSDAEGMAARFESHGANVIRVYSPNATWGAVKAAAKDANILVYLGHGSGFPSPYLSYEQPLGDNGMGLNASAAGSDYNLQYYGSAYMAQLRLAPNALVILNRLCYASGNNEGGGGLPSLAVAQQRVDGYASGFIRAGAKAVIADGLGEIEPYVDALFTTHTTIDYLWKHMPNFHDNVMSWPSPRNVGFTSQIDPDIQHPRSDGDYYYRSMVSIPGTTTDSIVSSQVLPWVSQSGTYHPLDPTRVVDTRGYGVGPIGPLLTDALYNFDIAGKAGVPAGAIAVTANVTVTNQGALGWVFIAPEITGPVTSSTINFPVGDNRANGVSLPLSPQGTVTAMYHGSRAMSATNLIIDVTGYYTADTSGLGYVKFGPQRIFDTRDGTGGSTGPMQSMQTLKIKVAGQHGLPASGIVAVAGNVTVVQPTSAGHLFVGPTCTSDPGTSTINFPAGDIRANNFIVPVAPDGTISTWYHVSNGAAQLDLLIDVFGYFTASGGARFYTLAPARILESRPPTPFGLTGPIPASSPRTLAVAGNGGVPLDAVAISANFTVTEQTYGSWVAIGPTISPLTIFSNVNFPVGDNRANGVITPLAGDGSVQVVYGAPYGQIQLILDVNGYFK